MDFSIEGLEVSKELTETDTKVPHIVSPLKEDSILDETIEK